ncbi:MAG TPA: class I SAM-dependent methyltransferase [Propylenella sp.]
MSRLDFMISRLTAQRALLQEAARLIVGMPGCVFELGLGSGRTFDHLRAILPDREIFAFDRAITAHPKCIPDGDHVILGEIRETLQFCAPRIPGKPALIHIDLGSGDPTQDLITRSWLSPLVAEWSQPGTVVLADRPLDGPFRTLPRPPDCPASSHVLLQAD